MGGNLALTPGDVVYENDLIQLIQYRAVQDAPSGVAPQVGVRPLVMVPPCINKFYILDLRPENSFVRYAVEQGHTVFMVSWRNVGPAEGGYDWDDYIEMGIFKAFEVAKAITQCDRVNALGFCVGGTLLAAALAVLAAKGEDAVESVTYLATMLDFEEPGQVARVHRREGASPRARRPSARAASCRAPTSPRPSTRCAPTTSSGPTWSTTTCWAARPRPSTCCTGTPTAPTCPARCTAATCATPTSRTSCACPARCATAAWQWTSAASTGPTFILATREDHIVPWRAAYRSLGLLGGEKQFVLGASGHIAGVINPPAGGKRSYWSVGTILPANPDDWLAQAQRGARQLVAAVVAVAGTVQGRQRAKPRPAQTGNAEYPAIEPAPGRYVKQKAA